MGAEDKGGIIMKSKDTLKLVIIGIAIIISMAIGFVLTEDTSIEYDEPRGPMTGGDEQIHPCEGDAITVPMDEMIFIPAYPGDECPSSDRVLIDTPIQVVDTDGTVYWHWFYENRTRARNRTG